MSNTLNQIPVDKTWSPLVSGRKIKSEVKSEFTWVNRSLVKRWNQKCKQYFEILWEEKYDWDLIDSIGQPSDSTVYIPM